MEELELLPDQLLLQRAETVGQYIPQTIKANFLGMDIAGENPVIIGCLPFRLGMYMLPFIHFIRKTDSDQDSRYCRNKQDNHDPPVEGQQ